MGMGAVTTTEASYLRPVPGATASLVTAILGLGLRRAPAGQLSAGRPLAAPYSRQRPG